jgi:hypothetical protein
LPEVAPEMNHANPLIRFSQPVQDLCRAIRTPIVNEDHLPGVTEASQFTTNSLTKVNQRFFLVEDWDNDRNQHFAILAVSRRKSNYVRRSEPSDAAPPAALKRSVRAYIAFSFGSGIRFFATANQRFYDRRWLTSLSSEDRTKIETARKVVSLLKSLT